jgi:hypothetical protein
MERIKNESWAVGGLSCHMSKRNGIIPAEIIPTSSILQT